MDYISFIDFDNQYFIMGCSFVCALLLFRIFYGLILQFFNWLGFKKFTHYLYAADFWYDIWLIDHCPYDDCSKCKAWTCPAYDKYHHHLCKCCTCEKE